MRLAVKGFKNEAKLKRCRKMPSSNSKPTHFGIVPHGVFIANLQHQTKQTHRSYTIFVVVLLNSFILLFASNLSCNLICRHKRLYFSLSKYPNEKWKAYHVYASNEYTNARAHTDRKNTMRKRDKVRRGEFRGRGREREREMCKEGSKNSFVCHIVDIICFSKF